MEYTIKENMTNEEMEAVFLAEQERLRDRISCADIHDISEYRTIAGVDLAYWKENEQERAVCCIAVIDINTHEVVERKHFSGEIRVPYIPGFLAFREIPLIMGCVELLENEPDIYMFDGNGYLHPRHMGIATQAALYLGKPSVGVAKTYFRVKDTDYEEPAPEAGSSTDIVIDGEVYGRVLRTHTGVKPVFVSAGNDISLDSAVKLAMMLTDKESHIPVPTRIADLDTHEARAAIRETGEYNG